MPSSEDRIWQHLDFYVRRYEGHLILVQTMLKLERAVPGDAGEIVTLYFDLEQLVPEWARAVMEQGAALEDGKSCDFVPPDENISNVHDP